MRTVAVVGASLAGLSAARALRTQGYDGRLVMVGDETHRPVLLEDSRRIEADTVVVGVGARPCVERLDGSGVAQEKGVRCDATWCDPAVRAHRRVEHRTGALERPAAAVTTLLSGGTSVPEPVRPPCFWSDQYGARIQFAGYAAGADSVTIEEGVADDRSFLAVHRRADHPVAVLGVNRPRPFMRRRRQLATEAARKAGSL